MTANSWYRRWQDGQVPEPDAVVCGVPHWRRGAITEWDAARPGAGAGAGRPKGARDSKPRNRTDDPRHQRAGARRARVRQLLDENAHTTAGRIAEDLGVSTRHAERLLSEVRQGR